MSNLDNSQYPVDVHNDIQFAGLLQVATAAADAQKQNNSNLGKRKRMDDSLIDTELRDDTNGQGHVGQSPGTPMLQASASVLFREPSEKSKKYSRPPLGKVYSDLQLAPEIFLKLQNAAKAYMLDEDHRERRDVVGLKREGTGGDSPKLKLWTCVQGFLNLDDNGQRFFGHEAGAGLSDTPHRTFFWPEHREKITKLCMPLFRKMVTNERQRIYASETRKQDPKKSEKDNMKLATRARNTQMSSEVADNQLASPHDIAGHELESSDDIHGEHLHSRQSTAPTHAIFVHVNVVDAGSNHARLAPRFTLPADSVSHLEALFSEVQKRVDIGELRHELDGSSGNQVPRVKVWLENGLVAVKDDGEWMVAQLSAGTIEWMDGELRVLVEI